MTSPLLLPLESDAPQMNVESGLADVSPAPPATPATVVGFVVAGGEVAEVMALPHPAAASAANPSTHGAIR
jgi:hypothetical protein